LPFSPTNTQLVPAVQLIALTALTDVAKDLLAVQVDPSLLERICAGALWYAEPAATQLVLEQEITSRVPDPLGN
jgi:hypothetical protein